MTDNQTEDIVTTLLTLSGGDIISNDQATNIKKLAKNLKHLVSKPVTEYSTYYDSYDSEYYFFEVCPSCDSPLDRTYQLHCINCGQKLKWIDRKKMTLKKPLP